MRPRGNGAVRRDLSERVAAGGVLGGSGARNPRRCGGIGRSEEIIRRKLSPLLPPCPPLPRRPSLLAAFGFGDEDFAVRAGFFELGNEANRFIDDVVE